MRLGEQVPRADYRERLLAVGTLCDTNGWHNLRLIECAEGLIVQYTESPAGRTFLTYLLTEDDLAALIREAPKPSRRDPDSFDYRFAGR